MTVVWERVDWSPSPVNVVLLALSPWYLTEAGDPAWGQRGNDLIIGSAILPQTLAPRQDGILLAIGRFRACPDMHSAGFEGGSNGAGASILRVIGYSCVLESVRRTRMVNVDKISVVLSQVEQLMPTSHSLAESHWWLRMVRSGIVGLLLISELESPFRK